MTPDADDRDVEALVKLFRRTMHQVNNDLMSMVQESELAIMSDDPDRMRSALETVADTVMAIARLHKETRRELLERTEGRESREANDGLLGGPRGADAPRRPPEPPA